MNIKISQLLNFSNFYTIAQSAKFPLKTTYKLSKLAAAIDIELDFYRQKLREILLEFGQLDDQGNLIPTEDGQGYKIKPGAEADCFAKVRELENIEAILPDITFSIDEFGDLQLTPIELAAAMPFITD